MCAIGGYLGAVDSEGITVSQLYEMAAAQTHRGPDGQGVTGYDLEGAGGELSQDDERSFRVGLLHRRLAILDTSEDGHQPMNWPYRDDKPLLSMVYNGEVYNYIEIRKELERDGIDFQTGTDTEVILAAYERWGTACFERFNGMWAIAILDWKGQRLVLSRDRLGIKPLHYACPNDGLVFSSELKAILKSGLVKAEVNPEMAVDFLKWGLTNHSLETAFSGIMSFPAGHWAEISFDTPTVIEPHSFWPLFEEEILENRESFEENGSRVRGLLRQSVIRRLRSDVEVGSCLSGGVDSSVLVMLASELLDGSMHTFTAASENKALDETEWAGMVVEKSGSKNHEVTPEVSGFLDDFSDLVTAQEEPFASASIYAQWCVMKMANQKGIKVLLDGQGADEVFFGYLKFYPTFLRELFQARKWWAFLKETGAFLLFGDRRIWRISEGIKYLPGWLYRSIPSCQSALGPEGQEMFGRSQSPQQSIRGAGKMRDGDILQFSLPALLRYEDRNSMAWSVEGRVPFLDPDIVSFALEVPISQMFRSGRPKAVLRKACEGVVPEPILRRRNKLGFEADQSNWMKGALGKAIIDRFASGDSRLEPWYDMKELSQLASAEKPGNAVSAELFRLFTFSVWLETFDLQISKKA